MKRFIILTATSLLSLSLNMALSQNAYAQNSNLPLEITADKTLEWLRGNNQFIANGNAVAQQGTSAIAAATLTANYTEGSNGIEIQTLTANESVIITSNNSKAYGDKADYDVTKGYATLTGNNLRMVAPDQTLTARDRFEYWVNDGRLNAVGGAKLTRKNQNGSTDTITANTLSAVFAENANGKRALKTMEAKNNVTIKTAQETVTGSYGIYRPDTNIAELRGGVKIIRGPNTLTGERATVNLNTNKSTIFASQNSQNGRVRGVFFPGSEKTP